MKLNRVLETPAASQSLQDKDGQYVKKEVPELQCLQTCQESPGLLVEGWVPTQKAAKF